MFGSANVPGGNFVRRTDYETDKSAFRDVLTLMNDKLEKNLSWMIRGVSGNPVVITDALNLPVKLLRVGIQPEQEGSGTPSPENIRPISSWSSVTVTRTDADGENPESVSISFGNAGTVCGGTLDVLTGALTVTHRKITLDPNKVSGNAGKDGVASGYFAANLTNVCQDYPGRKGDSTAILCDTLQPLFVYNLYTMRGVYIFGSEDSQDFRNACVRVQIDDVPGWTGGTTFNDSANIVKQFLADTPTTICYQLATPLTYTLTPAQLTLLARHNTIATDCGLLSVEYSADTAADWEAVHNAILSLGAYV